MILETVALVAGGYIEPWWTQQINQSRCSDSKSKFEW